MKSSSDVIISDMSKWEVAWSLDPVSVTEGNAVGALYNVKGVCMALFISRGVLL